VEPAEHACGLGVVISALERAVIVAGDAFAAAPIGEALREHHPSRRGGADRPHDPLAMYELNGGAAGHRTLRALEMLKLAGEELPVEATAAQAEWVAGLLRAIQRLAQLCWAPIPVSARTVILDEDDAGPAASPYITGCRSDRPGPSLAFERLREKPTLRPWREVARSARSTPAYTNARQHAAALEREPLRLEASEVRARVGKQAAALGRQRLRIHEFLDSRRQLVVDAYDGSARELRAAAAAIRAYNALVNHILFAVFGFAEQLRESPRFERELGSMRARVAHRDERVSVTVASAGALWVSPPDPFVIAAGGPLDGVYLSDSSMMQFAMESIVDISGVRLAAMEAAPDS
jgi:hypothetical protein